MDITKLAAEPQLVKIELTNEELVKKYGEVIEFYTWDRQPLEEFMRIASAVEDESNVMIDVAKDFILDAEGNKVLTGKTTLPNDVLIQAINAVASRLGNL